MNTVVCNPLLLRSVFSLVEAGVLTGQIDDNDFDLDDTDSFEQCMDSVLVPAIDGLSDANRKYLGTTLTAYLKLAPSRIEEAARFHQELDLFDSEDAPSFVRQLLEYFQFDALDESFSTIEESPDEDEARFFWSRGAEDKRENGRDFFA